MSDTPGRTAPSVPELGEPSVVVQPVGWEPQSEEQRRLRALVRHRDDLLQTQLQLENRLRDATDELMRSSLQTLLNAIATELAAVERRIKEYLAAQETLNTNLKLLTSSVGVGIITATRLLAEYADLEQYELAKGATADAGLTPSHYE